LFRRAVDWWQSLGEETTVSINGMQYSDGRVEHAIVVFLDNDDKLSIGSASEAREIGAALMVAADEFDRWTAVQP
jgi:hypothetical protein